MIEPFTNANAHMVHMVLTMLNLFTMLGFKKKLSSSNEDMYLEEPIKDHEHLQELLNDIKRVSTAKLKF